MVYSEKKYKPKISLDQSSSRLTILVAINLIVFVIFAFIKTLYFFHNADKNMAITLYRENVKNIGF